MGTKMSIKKIMKKINAQLAVGALTLLASVPAWAISAAGVASKVDDNFGAIGGMVINLFLLIGIVLVGTGLLKLKAHKDNPQQVPLSQPMTMLIIGGLLTVVLGIMTISGESSGLTGQGTGVTSESGAASSLFN